jgi:hypothetical protein
VSPPSNEKGAAPARTAPHTQDPAATRLTGSRASQGTATPDTSGPALDTLVGYVTGGTDRAPLDRLCAAALDGRALVEGGADRTTVAVALVVAAEAAGVPRRVAETVLLRTMRGAR